MDDNEIESRLAGLAAEYMMFKDDEEDTEVPAEISSSLASTESFTFMAVSTFEMILIWLLSTFLYLGTARCRAGPRCGAG